MRCMCCVYVVYVFLVCVCVCVVQVIVSQWVRSRSFQGAILCCSDSNIAVDNLLEGTTTLPYITP